MSNDTRFERLVADALTQAAPSDAPGTLVPDILVVASRSRRLPRWLAYATQRPMRRHTDVLVGSPSARTASVLLAATLVVVLGALALAAGGLVPPRNLPVVVRPSETQPSETPVAPRPTDALPPATTAPRPGLVAYTMVQDAQPGQSGCPILHRPQCSTATIWLASGDGSGARPLFANHSDGGRLLGWSSDGSRILYHGSSGLLMQTDPSGSNVKSLAGPELCAYPCAGSDGFAWSPDARRIAFVRTDQKYSTAVAILDLASGKVTEVPATRTTNVSSIDQCWRSSQCQGMDEMPRWSPDGTQLVFARQSMSPEGRASWTSAAVLVVNPDGTGLQRVTPSGLYAFDASWSPDGSTLVFTNVEMLVNSDHTSVTGELDNIYTVRPDGSDLRRLTADGISAQPSWTRDGRLTFARQVGTDEAAQYENWAMDADGGSQTKLGSSLAELSAAGCTTCLYPLGGNRGPSDAFWQPIP
jgi:hypothetical protein